MSAHYRMARAGMPGGRQQSLTAAIAPDSGAAGRACRSAPARVASMSHDGGGDRGGVERILLGR
jgi:hypothetical protein